MLVWIRCSVLTDGLLQFFVSFLHILQTKNLQRAFSFSLTADQLIDLPETTWIHQTDLQVRRRETKESVKIEKTEMLQNRKQIKWTFS